MSTEYVPMMPPVIDPPFSFNVTYTRIPFNDTTDRLRRRQVKPTRDEIEHSGLEVIKALQLKQYEVDGKVLSSCTSQCVVCLEDYTTEEEVRVMGCRHTFHRGCVDKWMETMQNSCPACRSTGVSVRRSTFVFPAADHDIVLMDSRPTTTPTGVSASHEMLETENEYDVIQPGFEYESDSMIVSQPSLAPPPMNPHQPLLASHTPTAVNSHQPSLASRISPTAISSHQPSLASRISSHSSNSRPPRRHRGRGRAGLSTNCKTNQSKTRSTKCTRAQRYHVPSIS